MKPTIPRFLAISDQHRLDQPLPIWLDELQDAGVDTIQIREKELDDRMLWQLAREVQKTVKDSIQVLINGRFDIARMVRAEGVHLPARGLPVGVLRQAAGPSFLIGRSTHHVDEIEDARQQGADYVTFGPIFPTPSKPGQTDIPGLDGLKHASTRGLPVLALGGLDTLERAQQALDHGACGVAAIRLFQDRKSLAGLSTLRGRAD